MGIHYHENQTVEAALAADRRLRAQEAGPMS